MIKYFELLMEFNWIQNKKYLESAKEIEKNKDKELLIYHKDWYFFHYYHKLLKEEINEEEFTKIWDISNNLEIYRKQEILKSIEQINNLEDKKLKDKIIIIDSSAKIFSDWIDKMIYIKLKDRLNNLNTILIIL